MKTTLLFLLISIKIFSQDFENLKMKDTIFLIFENNEVCNKLNSIIIESKNNDRYVYKFSDKEILYFTTIQNEKSKKILKKNISKLNVYNLKSIEKNGCQKTLNIFFYKKIILYLVDKRKTRCRKWILKRIYLENTINTII